MARNKHLWRRLQSLEQEYDALLQSDICVRNACFPYRPLLACPLASGRDTCRLDRLHREIAALRLRFGINPQYIPAEPLPRPRIIVHRLPPGMQHPITPQEILLTLAELPSRHLENLRAVILSDRRRDRYASYGRRRIRLFYPVDARYRVRLHRNEGCREVMRFGAWLEEEHGRLYVCWEPEDLKNYVLRHLLPHEIGHHVAWLRGCGYTVLATRREEAFAESYAHACFDPSHGRAMELSVP